MMMTSGLAGYLLPTRSRRGIFKQILRCYLYQTGPRPKHIDHAHDEVVLRQETVFNFESREADMNDVAIV